MTNIDSLSSARKDFRRARQRAALRAVLARLTGKSISLLSFEDVYRKLRVTSRAERGLREIPLSAIIGSVGRYTDFTRDFLPRQDTNEERWAAIKALADDPVAAALPPIEVYQIGEVYFVRDGHHRVSVAREMGASHIEAYVTEVRTKVPLSPEVQPDELIVMAEQAAFLESTGLDRLRPEADIRVSVPGQYFKLENHIEVHRFFLEEEQGREIPDDEAVGRWYDDAYLPVVQTIREQGILRGFPGRTETDLYIWVIEHQFALQHDLGWSIKFEAALTDLAARFGSRPGPPLARMGQKILEVVLPNSVTARPATGEWRREKLTARYSDRLFADVLVPLSGEDPGWCALDQALVIAQRESARLQGLHVVQAEAQRESPAARALQAEFARRCDAAQVPGRLAVEVGDVARKVCERALLADLVILNLAHPPGPQAMARLSSGMSGILRRCARPVLAVPGTAMPLRRVLLAYDDSPKAREALFVATYIAEQWQAGLCVVLVPEPSGTDAGDLDYARRYLEWHEIPAEFDVKAPGPVAAAVGETAAAWGADLIVMGGYGASTVVEVALGSTVDEVLRGSSWPMLICR